jgi:DNA primase
VEKNALLLTVLTEVLGKVRKSNKHRGQYSYDCPVCSMEKGLRDGDGKGKFEVNLKRNVYKCWVCHETHYTHGSIKKLLWKFGGNSVKSKIKKLGLEFKFDSTKDEPIIVKDVELPIGFQRFEDANKHSMQYKEGWSYLTKQRRLSPETIYKHQMGFTTHKPEKFDDDYTNRVIIPSYDKDGELNYFTARSWLSYSKLRYKNPEVPRETIIFNESLINWDGTVYIVEGPFDHLVVPNSIPLLGKDIHDKLMQSIMNRCTGHVVVLLDGEEKVWKTAKNIYTKINIGKVHGRVKIIKLREDYDISKINEDFGRKGVVEALRSSFKIKESKL